MTAVGPISRHLARCCWRHSVALPKLQQGSTLLVRSQIPAHVIFQPAWRDNGHASLLVRRQQQQQTTQSTEEEVQVNEPLIDFKVNQEEPDRRTSLGRFAPQVSIHLQDLLEEVNASPSPAHLTETTLTLQIPEQINLTCDLTAAGGDITITGKVQGDAQLRTAAGDIHVTKLRGHDIRLQNTPQDDDDDDNSDKIDAHSDYNHLYSMIRVDQAIEAASLQIETHGRVRAKQIHGASIHVSVDRRRSGLESNQQRDDCDDNRNDDDGSDDDTLQSERKLERQHQYEDADDEGSLVDISALFVSPTGSGGGGGSGDDHDDDDSGTSGGATIHVKGGSNSLPLQRRAVRIKSHHGPLQVTADGAGVPTQKNPLTQQRYPTVELGGVNGNCEVLLMQGNNRSNMDRNDHDDDHDWDSCLVHVDSLEPESVSVVTADHGNVAVTLDRKVEADLRLVSLFGNNHNHKSGASQFLPETTALLAEEEDTDLIVQILQQLGEQQQQQSESGDKKVQQQDSDDDRIQLHTKAFTQERRLHVPQQQHRPAACLEYVQGFVQNKSAEPDSRFDRKLQQHGTAATSSIGKINLQGAADQALSGFSSSKEEKASDNNDSDDILRPLVAVIANNRKITVETVSWLGAIARRYGLEEEETSRRPAGRTAARRGRQFAWEAAAEDTTTTTSS